jgi:DNA end-binding protein Ku
VRAIWKGAISFGLVHIPVELYPASTALGIDLDMLDKRDFAPIGYKRYNKVTGKEVKQQDIVKGYQHEKGEYVVLTEADIKKANVESTQTIDILSFAQADEITPIYFDQPYYLAPSKGGEKVYLLLRETLKKSNKVGIAQVVIRTKQHLAALIVVNDVIVLNLVRYPEELRPIEDLNLPAANSKRTQVTDKEIKMALSLVNDMTEPWDPSKYQDTFKQDLLALIKKKIKAGQTHALTEPEEDEESTHKDSNVVDLMALLKRSIDSGKPSSRKPSAKNQVAASSKTKRVASR